MGKTVTTEFASADPSPTHNPWNAEHTPGGSSLRVDRDTLRLERPSTSSGGFAQEVVRSCILPFDKLRANGWFIAPFVVSLSNHNSAFGLLVQSQLRANGAVYSVMLSNMGNTSVVGEGL